MNAIYQIYPLGACGAPQKNDLVGDVCYRLSQLEDWAKPIQGLGIDTVYLGPVWESLSHGYDTVDFRRVDRRLGDADTLRNLVYAWHQAGLRVLFDTVFNHVGRGFFAFQDVLQNRNRSQYVSWFCELNLAGENAYGDHLTYADWNGCQDLVKLDVSHVEVRDYLCQLVEFWVHEFHIDGLRLDAADALDSGFVQYLAKFCRERFGSSFWLLGEMVHGDYRRLLGKNHLDSVTNYELYKALYSSCNDGNMHELAYAVYRQSAPNAGVYCVHKLCTFVDNHDVNRIASTLREPRHLPLLYMLLATLPGVPALYYGSEWGMKGVRDPHSDWPLRPALDVESVRSGASTPLARHIGKLLNLRSRSQALSNGETRQLKVDSWQYAFLRSVAEESIVVCVNIAGQATTVRLDLPDPLPYEGSAVDLIDGSYTVSYGARTLYVDLPAYSGRILRLG